MSDPAQVPARAAMDVSHILNRVFQLLRANLRLFVGIAAVPPLVMYGLLALVAAAVLIPVFTRLHRAPSQQEIVQILLVFVPLAMLTFLLFWLVFALYLAAGSHAAVQADNGVPVTFGESYAIAWRRAGRYFLLLLIIYAICFIPALAIQLGIASVIGLSALDKAQPNPIVFALFPLGMLLELALFVVGFIVALRLSLAFPAAAAENLSAVEAVKRSSVLTRGVKLKIFLVLLVIYAATYLATLVLMCGLAFAVVIGVLVFSGMHLDFASPVTVSLAVLAGLGLLALMVLFMACSWAGYTTALCVIYNDQRRRVDPVLAFGAPPA